MSLDITDSGEFVNNIYHLSEASSFLSRLIGRGNVLPKHGKSTFGIDDIAQEGYLLKEGSWRKTWKKRYFILRKDTRQLCYFNSSENLTLLGAIPVNEHTIAWSESAKYGGAESLIFHVQWRDASNKQRDIRLRSNDVATMIDWLQAISDEVLRTDEVKIYDWWNEMYGEVSLMDAPRMRETIRKRQNSVLYSPSSTAPNPFALPETHSSFMEPIDVRDTEGDLSADDAMLSAEQIRDKEDQSAEMAAASVLSAKRTEAFANSKYASGNRSGFFTDADKEDDEEEGECCKPKREDDCDYDEEYVYEVPLGEEEELVKSLSLHPEESTVSDEGKLSEELKTSASVATMTSGKTIEVESPRVPPSTTKKKKKEKVEKPAGPPPFEHPCVRRHEINGALCGMHLSILLEHLLEGNEKLFLGVSVCHMNSSSKSSSGSRTSADPNTVWRQISRTEVVTNNDVLEYGKTIANRVTKQFKILLEPVILEECTHVMIVVFKTGRKDSSDGRNLTSNIALCRCIIRKEFFIFTQGLFKVPMTILTEPSYDINSVVSVTPKATLGVLLISSYALYKNRLTLTSAMRTEAYAETLYCFQNTRGQTLTLEQIFTTRVSAVLPRAFLDFLIQERLAQLDVIRRRVKKELIEAIETLKKISTSSAMTAVEGMLTGNFENESPTITAVSRADGLKQAKKILGDIEDKIIEAYIESYEHCGNILQGKIKGNVIPAEVGGACLRRSVWKKSPVWQFCPTNLNYNILSIDTFSIEDLRSAGVEAPMIATSHSRVSQLSPLRQGSTLRTDEENNYHDSLEVLANWATSTKSTQELDNFLSVTLGCPTAHALHFHDGGLRRAFQNLAPSLRLDWLSKLQATGGMSTEFIEKIASNPVEASCIFEHTHDTQNTEVWSNLIRTGSKLCLRLDMCCSQTLSFAVAVIKGVIIMAAQGSEFHEHVLIRAFAMGDFMIPINSFLSTQGSEMGMIEDLDAAMLWLCSVSVRLVREPEKQVHATNTFSPNKNPSTPSNRRNTKFSQYRKSHSSVNGKDVVFGACEDITIRRAQDSGNIVVDVYLSNEEYEVVSHVLQTSKILAQMERAHRTHVEVLYSSSEIIPTVLTTFNLTGILFNQGINEMQTLSNMSFVGSGGFGDLVHQVQDVVRRHLDLKADTPKSPQSSLKTPPKLNHSSSASLLSTNEDLAEIDKMMREVTETIAASSANPAEKNVSVLLKSSWLCRKIAGTIGILCKSGKDRTSMGVTLEQAKMLAETTGVIEGKEACLAMRKHGVRRMNVYANTGQAMYAFNKFQYQLLPVCYRPPTGTFTGKVAT